MCERSVVPRIVGSIVLVVQITSTGCERRGETSALDLPIGSIEQEIRIGSLDEPGYALTQVGALEVAPDGSMYSLHPQESQIRRWSPEGESMGTIGRQGEGPGEFTAPLRMGWRADSLWVFDSSRNSRISFFDPSGTYLATLTPAVDIGTVEQAIHGIHPARPAGLLGDGTIHGATPGISRDLVDGKLTSIAHVRMRRDGSVIDTVLIIQVGRESALSIELGDARMYSTQPFGDGVLSTLTRDRGAFLIVERPSSAGGGRSEFRLHRVELDGDTAYSRSYPYVAVSIPPDTVDSYIDALAERLQRYAGPRNGTTVSRWVGAAREAMYTPEFYPPVSRLVAGRDGTIWLARSPGTEVGTEWLVLDSDGEAIGRVEVPRAMTLMMAEWSTIWGTERDEFDVDYIVRYSVRFPDTKQ